jgi:hypothetical protein
MKAHLHNKTSFLVQTMYPDALNKCKKNNYRCEIHHLSAIAIDVSLYR